MNGFISKVLGVIGVSPRNRKLNCCRATGTLIDDTMTSFIINLPGGTTIEVYTPNCDSCSDDMGYAYIPEVDAESPDMCAEDLGCWLDTNLSCVRRIKDYLDKAREQSLNSSLLDLDAGRDKYSEDAMQPEEISRAVRVFNAACEGVELPPQLFYQATRTSTDGEYIIRTLMAKSTKMGRQQWVHKSALRLESEVAVDTDGWSFIPNYDPESEAGISHRQGSFNLTKMSVYTYDSTGDDEENRDKRAAYWLVTMLQKMVDALEQSPPNRVYDIFLAEGLSNMTTETVLRMNEGGIMQLLKKGILTGDKVMKARPELAKKLIEKGYIQPEEAAAGSPDTLLWLVRKGLISPESAIKIKPEIKEILIKKKLYSEPTESVEEEEIIDNPDENLDSSCGGKKQMNMNSGLYEEDDYSSGEWEYVKSKEIADWDGFTTEYTWYRNADGKNVFVYGDSDMYRPEDGDWDFETDNEYEAQEWFDSYYGPGEDDLDAARRRRGEVDKSKNVDMSSSDVSCSESGKVLNIKAPKRGNRLNSSKKAIPKTKAPKRKLNSSLSLNSQTLPEEKVEVKETYTDNSEYPEGYEQLSATTIDGPAFVAEVILPEDKFDGIVVPGDSEDEAKETLTQMLLANDGTFIDWKPIDSIQKFKTDNTDRSFVVLN